MADGTTIRFGGFNCRAVTFRRSVGVDPDGSLVEIVSSVPFPGPFTFVDELDPGVGSPGGVGQGGADQTRTRGTQFGSQAPGEQPTVIRSSGALVMREDVAQTVWQTVVSRLFVTRVERLDASNPTGIMVYALADQRVFWGRGFLPRWEFNTFPAVAHVAAAPPDGLFRSITRQNEPSETRESLTLREIVEFVLRQTILRPTVVRVPPAWETDRPRYVFDPFTSPRDALEKILRREKAVVSLHLDDTVGFYLEQEGSVGWNAPGAFDNVLTLPREHVEHLSGQGDTLGRTFAYPPRGVLVFGEPRLCTVWIDGWEPVVLVNGSPVPLEAAFLSMLRGEEVADLQAEFTRLDQQVAATKDAAERRLLRAEAERVRVALAVARARAASGQRPDRVSDEDWAWLRAFVLRPEAHRARPGMSRGALETLSRDAFRLWRLPGAETTHAHLLPMRPRAETGPDGTPLPVLVETYRYRLAEVPLLVSRRKKREGGGPRTAQQVLDDLEILTVETQLHRVDAQLAESRRIIYARAFAVDPGRAVEAIDTIQKVRFARKQLGLAFKQGPGSDANLGAGAAAGLAGAVPGVGAIVGGVIRGAGAAAVSREDQVQGPNVSSDLRLNQELLAVARAAFERGLSQIRPELIAEDASIADLGATATGYRATLAERNKLVEQVDPEATDLLDEQFARALIDLGQANKGQGPGTQIQSGDVERLAIQIRDRIASRERRRAAGEVAPGDPSAPILTKAFTNEPRLPDVDAVVEDPDLGLVRTPQPVGHLEEPNVPSLEGSRLARGPGPSGTWPVRVRFGCFLRPPEKPTAFGPRDGTGDAIPPQMIAAFAAGDPSLGLYRQGFVLAASESEGEAPTAKPVDLKDLPPGDVETVYVALRERILRDGGGNRARLDAEAAKAAQPILARDRIQDVARRQYVRPWPVNPNGVVTGIEIASRPGIRGFRTLVVEGRSPAVFEDQQPVARAERGAFTSVAPARPDERADPR